MIGERPTDREILLVTEPKCTVTVGVPEDVSGVVEMRFYVRGYVPRSSDAAWAFDGVVSVAPMDETVTKTITLPDDGFFELAARAVDAAGNISLDFLPCEKVVAVDTVPPILTDITVALYGDGGSE